MRANISLNVILLNTLKAIYSFRTTSDFKIFGANMLELNILMCQMMFLKQSKIFKHQAIEISS